MAVAEERQRNASSRRLRAEAEADAGEQTGTKITAQREAAATDRAAVEAELQRAEAELARHQETETEVRRRVAEARTGVEGAERQLREAQDRARRAEHDRERAHRELDEVTQRNDALSAERAQLADALTLTNIEHEESQAHVEAMESEAAAAADAVRAGHPDANPGPLLLLPLDVMTDSAAGDPLPDALSHLVNASAPARAWVRNLLGHVHAVDDGRAFVDARGAVWLPGNTAGPGPLRRRAELAELRMELQTLERGRADASAAADAMREALTASEQRVLGATEASSLAQQQVRAASEYHAEVGRRVARATKEAADAAALAERLNARRIELQERGTTLDRDALSFAEQVQLREQAIAEARQLYTDAESAHDEAREQRTNCQIAQAQVRARMQMAADLEHRLSQEVATASQRLAQLRDELSELAQSDATLAEQMAMWTLDLETREATLSDGEARLSEAETAVQAADEALEMAEHALSDVRRQAGGIKDALHQEALRYTELNGHRAALRDRLE